MVKNRLKDNKVSNHMREEEDVIILPDIPKDKDYEYYVAAVLQCGGYYLERNIIKREEGKEMLELDIVAKKFSGTNVNKILIEVKSGQLQMSDIFKVRGWMDYLDIDKGVFVVQKEGDLPETDTEKIKRITRKICLNFVVDEISNNKNLLNVFHIDEKVINNIFLSTYRFSYAIEVEMEKDVKNLKKTNPQNRGIHDLDHYLFEIKSNSFFHSDARSRIENIVRAFATKQNIFDQLFEDKLRNEYSDYGDISIGRKKILEKLFLDATQPDILYVWLYANHIARLTILNACVESIFVDNDKWNEESDQGLLFGIKRGMEELKSHKYVKFYPYFWQVFTYLYGGFILIDNKEEEFLLLSEITQIPIEEIPNAFRVLDILFPTEVKNSWFTSLKDSTIELLKFFPIPLRGMGLFFRINYLYRLRSKIENKISGKQTKSDLMRWSILTHAYLKNFTKNCAKKK